jgi:hypothetical protein
MLFVLLMVPAEDILGLNFLQKNSDVCFGLAAANGLAITYEFIGHKAIGGV